jgi:hypothetical protein
MCRPRFIDPRRFAFIAAATVRAVALFILSRRFMSASCFFEFANFSAFLGSTMFNTTIATSF